MSRICGWTWRDWKQSTEDSRQTYASEKLMVAEPKPCPLCGSNLIAGRSFYPAQLRSITSARSITDAAILHWSATRYPSQPPTVEL